MQQTQWVRGYLTHDIWKFNNKNLLLETKSKNDIHSMGEECKISIEGK